MTENREGFQVLRECPQVIPNKGSVEGRVEDECKYCGNGNDIVRFDSIEILIVAGLEGSAKTVQDISTEQQSKPFLDFEDEIASCIVRQVALNIGVAYLEEHEEDEPDPEDDGIADEGFAGEAGDGPALSYLDGDECESEGLNCSCEGEDE